MRGITGGGWGEGEVSESNAEKPIKILALSSAEERLFIRQSTHPCVFLMQEGEDLLVAGTLKADDY